MASSFLNQLVDNSRVLIDVSSSQSLFSEKLIITKTKTACKMQLTLSKMLMPKD